MSAADATQALLAGLREATHAFEDGDAIAGSAALDQVVRACAALEAAGVRLDESTLEDAGALHRACAAAALEAGRALAARLQSAGAARRAVGAYATPAAREGPR